MANLYNQIKEVEVLGGTNGVAMSQWKAGFIEDALDLHLASKPNIAGVIRAWSEDSSVQKAFEDFAPNGHQRWVQVIEMTKT